mgnify:FL=1
MIKQPPHDRFLMEHLGSRLYLWDAAVGHRHAGWDHETDRYLLVEYDPIDPQDRGLVGSNLEAMIGQHQFAIEQRKRGSGER